MSTNTRTAVQWDLPTVKVLKVNKAHGLLYVVYVCTECSTDVHGLLFGLLSSDRRELWSRTLAIISLSLTHARTHTFVSPYV